jgi:membrane-bound lytic murein transglycosylase F
LTVTGSSSPRRFQRRAAPLLALAAALWLLASCGRLDPPQSEGMLVVAVLPEPGGIPLPDGSPGPGYTEEVLRAFAAQIGVPVRVLPVLTADELQFTLRSGRAHIGAYLNPQPAPDGLVFSQAIATMPLWVVTHDETALPNSLADLVSHAVYVVPGSAAAAALRALPEGSRPEVIDADGDTQQTLLKRLGERRIDYAAVDELNLRIAANVDPDLQPAVKLFGQRELAFAIPSQWRETLQNPLDDFITKSRADGLLRRLYDRHYGHVQRVSPELIARFLSDVRTVLPKYRSEFQRAQERTGLDWRLIAALAYHESHWDPLATSPTGVRGMMMLTEETADHLKVDNRLDPAQSIRGGADYLASLMEQLPASITMPDRLWFALAAYNLGMGHLNGGRAIAQGMERDPDNWYEMKSVLPQLSRPEIYQRLKSGRARGGEAVILVENVRNLFGVLARIEPAYVSPLAGADLRRRTAVRQAGQGLRPDAQAPGFRLPTPPQ